MQQPNFKKINTEYQQKMHGFYQMTQRCIDTEKKIKFYDAFPEWECKSATAFLERAAVEGGPVLYVPLSAGGAIY